MSPARNSSVNRDFLLFFHACLLGLMVGTLMFFLTRGAYTLGFPALVCGAVGFGGIIFLIWHNQIHRRRIALFCALFLGTVIYCTYRYEDYLGFRTDLHNQIAQRTGETLDTTSIDQLVDQALEKKTGFGGFIGYLKYNFNEGLIIEDTVYQTRTVATNVDILVYWLLDIAAIFGLLIIGAYVAPYKAFCEHCQRYYGNKFLGNVPSKLINDLAQ